MFRVGMAAAILLGLADCASAAVVEVSAAGFEVKNEVTVNASSEAVYFALLQDIGGFESIAPAVDAVLRDQLERLKTHVETRKAP